MNDPLHIAVAGAGLIGRVHLEALRASPDCIPAAVIDPSDSAAEIARAAGVRHHESLASYFASTDTADRADGIILATPNALHKEHALACMEQGLPMLLEKPLAASVAEGEAIVREATSSGARLLVGHHRTHSGILRAALETIDSGILGRLVSVTGSATFVKPDDYFSAAPWRTRPGGGPILINLIHEIQSLRLLCGEIVAVQAFGSNAVRRHDVEDTVAINLRFANGVLGTFLLSDTAASPHSWEHNSGENPAYAHHPEEACYVVAGTDGSLAIPTLRLHHYERSEDRSWWKPFTSRSIPFERDDPIARQLEHFCRMIRGTESARVTAADGLANLRVTEAVGRAARTGETVLLGAIPGFR